MADQSYLEILRQDIQGAPLFRQEKQVNVQGEPMSEELAKPIATLTVTEESGRGRYEWKVYEKADLWTHLKPYKRPVIVH